MKKFLLYLSVSALAMPALAGTPGSEYNRAESPADGTLLATPYSKQIPQNGVKTLRMAAPILRAADDTEDRSLYPAKPETVFYGTGANYGQVVLEWSSVTTNELGQPMTDITYTICKDTGTGDLTPIVTDLTECEYTVQECDPNAEQTFVMYAVFAVSADGKIGIGKATEMIPVGKPYTMPYHESFEFYTAVGQETLKGQPEWTPYPDAYLPSQDGDNVSLMFAGKNVGDASRIFTGRILIPDDAENPAFTYFQYGILDISDNTIQVQVNDGGGYVNVGPSVRCGDAPVYEWVRHTVSLDEFKGKAVQMGIVVTAVNAANEAIDNMNLVDLPKKDLAAALALDGGYAAIGSSIPMQVRVNNYGVEAADGYTIEFYANSVPVGSLPGVPLAAGDSYIFDYDYVVPVDADQTISLHAVVNFAGDGDLKNNYTDALSVIIERPVLPEAKALEATVDGSDVTLTWEAPSYEGRMAQIQDTFENYDSFATVNKGDAGGWQFFDQDGGKVGGFQGFDIPNVPKEGPASFFILDNNWDYFYGKGQYMPRSGNKMLAVLYNWDKSANDDWAISPELSGAAQTISFYARAFDEEYPETLEMLYSTTDTNIESFKSVRVQRNIPNNNYEFIKYQFDVPEGAKYFAFRFISTYTFMLFIDDVTYAPAGSGALNLTGYNVYRDGKKLNDTPISDCIYTDKAVTGQPGYVVTAVYNDGESMASNRVYPLGQTGVDAAVAKAVVKAGAGEIIVAGFDGAVQIFDLQGRCIYAGDAGRISVAPGAYIVRVADRAVKVFVK